MNSPLVSIGVALFNDEKWVRRTLESIIFQQHQNIEVILSDDCSSDETAGICQEFAGKDSRVKYIRQKRNIGALANHELLFNLSSGDYFMWSNGHDFFESNYILNCLESLESDPSIALCCGKTLRIDINGNQEALLYNGLDTRCLDTIESFKAVFSSVTKNACLFYGLFRSNVMKKSKLHRKTIGGDLIFINEIGLLGNVLQRDDTTFYRQCVRDSVTAEQSTQRWMDVIVQPKAHCLEAVTPWLNMAYEYLDMITISARPLWERESLLDAAIELINNQFGSLIKSDIEKLLTHEIPTEFGCQTRNIYLTEIVNCLNTAKFFYPDPYKLDERLHKYLRLIGHHHETAIEEIAKKLGANNPPDVKLYAGDIPDRPEYSGWVGLSLSRADERHIHHDITQSLPFPDNSVTAFQAEDVFEHIPYHRLVTVLNEIHRVLKPGGYFRLSVPDYRCDILYNRSEIDASGNVSFDPLGGGTTENPGHLWFPHYEEVKYLLEASKFHTDGTMCFLHYYDEKGQAVTKPIDYSKGFIQRTPDFDVRVQAPYRPMSLVVDLEKRSASPAPASVKVEGTHVPNTRLVKVSFVMIVLNGMPFVEYALKAIYEEAHEIIIVEGAVENCLFAANPDGSSVDGTVECIRSFPDPYRKIQLIQGRWPEKCEMQNAALEHVTGNYVWLVDSDEVYKREDISRIRSILADDPTITQVNFIPDNFWKGFDYLFVSPRFFEPACHYRRLFKFKPGSHFTTHRPPTIVWPGSDTTTEEMHLVDGQTTRRMGIIPYHYSYVLDSQVQQKIELYRRYGWGVGWGVDLERWYHEFFQRWTLENSQDLEQLYPIWTGDPNSCSVPFTGTHPEVMAELIASYRAGEISERTNWRTQLYNQLRPQTLVPQEYINVYQNLASKSLALPGDILEIGVYRGGSLFRLAEHLENNHLSIMSQKRLIGIDTFQGHPHSEPGVDPAHHPKGRFSDTSYKDVKRAMSLFPFVDVLMGDCAEIFTTLPAEQKFCLVNIDVDVKKSAVDALNYVYPRLAVGGAIIFDEFEGYGQEGYIRDFFRDKPVEMKPRTGRSGQDYGLIVIKGEESCVATLPGSPEEEEVLATVGAVKYQRKVLDAWSHVELDAPLLLRKECMEQHIENGSPFWNIHVALAFVASRFQPLSYLEIGVRTGASMVQVLHNAAPERVTGVDLWTGNYALLPNHREFTEGQLGRYQYETGRKTNIELIQGDSHILLKNMITQGQKYDLITVDGDHSDQGAMEDLEDAYQLLYEKGIIVFDDIIHPSFKSLLEVIREFVRRHPDLQLVLNTSQDNGVALLLRGIRWSSLKGYRIAGEGVVGSDLTQIQEGSDFETSLRELVLSVKPRAIIETGTYLGNGTTRIIATALRDAGLAGTTFYSIECNPNHHQQACSNLGQAGLLPFVKLLHGLSVPRNLLPTVEKINDDTVRNVVGDDVFVDHQEQNRVALYFRETDFPDIHEDLLGACLEQFGRRPDLVLLDSAGHMGNVEFNYVIERLQGECYLVLDDICHIKHYRSFQQLQNDPRFTVIKSSEEKFGFCIAKFNPDAQKEHPVKKKRILWVRTDSIGDNILASSMLPHIRGKYPAAEISVVCQGHIAELYENCPFVDRIISIPTEHRWENGTSYGVFIEQIRQLNPDVLLNSTYSVHGISDLPGLEFIPERIAFRDAPNAFYTRLVSSLHPWKPELERHHDFLASLSIHAGPLSPMVWLNDEDEIYACDVFTTCGLDPATTIVLFPGARTFHRYYSPEKYAEAINGLSSESFTFIVMGGVGDREAVAGLVAHLRRFGHVAIDMAGTTTIRQMAAILRKSRLYVGTETAAAHICCAVGTPNVVLLGGGHFGRFMPYSPLTSIVCLPLDCYGCNWECRYDEVIYCIASIVPATITAAIRGALQRHSEKPRVFMQGKDFWGNRTAGRPSWKMFDLYLDTNTVEAAVVEQTANSTTSHYPKISIVTPSFNQAEFLEECITSVLSQNYPNLEYIIMDGGSTDGSVEIIRKYENRLTYWQSTPDGGQYAAINEGFRRSTGDIMAWLNSDDKYHPGALHIIAATFTGRKEIEWITGRPTAWNEAGELTLVREPLPVWSYNDILTNNFTQQYIQQESTFWKRSLWEKAGAELDESYKLAADLELWARFFRHARLFSLDALIGGFRSHARQKTANMFNAYKLEAAEIIVRERHHVTVHSCTIPCAPEPLHVEELAQDVSVGLKPEFFTWFSYSKLTHFPFFRGRDRALYGTPINLPDCDLKKYQDLLVYTFICENIPKGARLLEIGGGDSRILKSIGNDYECWNIDKLEGAGSGPTAVTPNNYRLIKDYIGEFNKEVPDEYFDFVFSISALEHVQGDEQTYRNIRADIDRVMKPGAYSLHCFDVVMQVDSVWTNLLLPYLFETTDPINPFIPFGDVRLDPALFCMTEKAYANGWQNITKKPYNEFGWPFSYNILWQKKDGPFRSTKGGKF